VSFTNHVGVPAPHRVKSQVDRTQFNNYKPKPIIRAQNPDVADLLKRAGEDVTSPIDLTGDLPDQPVVPPFQHLSEMFEMCNTKIVRVTDYTLIPISGASNDCFYRAMLYPDLQDNVQVQDIQNLRHQCVAWWLLDVREQFKPNETLTAFYNNAVSLNSVTSVGHHAYYMKDNEYAKYLQDFIPLVVSKLHEVVLLISAFIAGQNDEQLESLTFEKENFAYTDEWWKSSTKEKIDTFVQEKLRPFELSYLHYVENKNLESDVEHITKQRKNLQDKLDLLSRWSLRFYTYLYQHLNYMIDHDSMQKHLNSGVMANSTIICAAAAVKSKQYDIVIIRAHGNRYNHTGYEVVNLYTLNAKLRKNLKMNDEHILTTVSYTKLFPLLDMKRAIFLFHINDNHFEYINLTKIYTTN